MNYLILSFFQDLYFSLPFLASYFSPYFLKKQFKKLDRTIKINHHHLFGNLTYQILALRVFSSLIIVYVQFSLYDFIFFRNLSIYNYANQPILFGVLIGFGFLFGDLFANFVKEKSKSKKNFLILHKISLFFWGTLFSSFLFIPSLKLLSFLFFLALLIAFLERD